MNALSHQSISAASQQQVQIHTVRDTLAVTLVKLRSARSEMKLPTFYLFGIFAFVSSSTSTDVQKITNAIKMRNWNEIFQIKDLTRDVPTNRKAPEFMMELYDAVADSNGTLKNSKVLEGNIVRSFEGA